jgi:hypothetical protein
MNINAMLSRKLILSMFLFFAATMAMARGMITETQWQWVVMATAVSYVAGATLQADRDMSSMKSIRLWGERLKALFSREYLGHGNCRSYNRTSFPAAHIRRCVVRC